MEDTRHGPHGSKLDMQKFDGTALEGWVSQMEHFVFLHNICVADDKYQVALLYLDAKCWQWWQWHKQCICDHIEWSIFSKALCAHSDWERHYLGRLTKLWQTRMVQEYIATFEKLAIHTKNLVEDFYTECFISGLKEPIRAHVQGNHPPTWTQACHQALDVEVIINSQNPQSTFPTKRNPVPSSNQVPPLKIQRLSSEEMEDRKRKGLCYNCDEKYVQCHHCREKNIFHIDVSTTPEMEEVGLEEPSMEEITEQPFPVPDIGGTCCLY
jgi:hypothetical protein